MTSKTLVFDVTKKDFHKTVQIPTSKSYGNRLLILASLEKKPVRLRNLPRSTDVLTMIDCLKAIGLEINQEADDLVISNSFPECEKLNPSHEEIIVFTGDGGTTTRFLASLLCRGSKTYRIEPSGGMRNRPMTEFLEAAKKLGVNVTSSSEFWLKIKGPITLKNAELAVDCSRSTQFATGFAMVCADLGISIRPVEMNASEAYYEMTNELIKHRDKTLWEVPVDFSGASYPIALGAVTGEVRLPQIHAADPFQADAEFLNLLQDIGAQLEWRKDGLVVSKAKLKPFDVDISRYPDLSPTLCFLASTIEGESFLRNIEVLRYKETDRVAEMIKVLELYEIEFELSQNFLKIKGRPSMECAPKIFHAPEDHRIIMMTYLFMRTFSGGVIHGAEHVKKSFPDFFKVMD